MSPRGSRIRRGTRPIAFAALLALTGVPVGAAQEWPVVESDRPDVANSAKTVPRGALQVESGVAYARERFAAAPPDRRLSLELTLRAGITPRLEARLDGEPVVRLRGRDDATGAGDLRLGLKYRFLDARGGAWWPALGIQPFVKLPSAPDPIGSERADFGILGIASFDLPADLSLDANAGLAAVGQRHPGGYLVQGAVAATLAREVVEDLTGFVELFFFSRDTRDGRDALGGGAGVIYRIGRRALLDFGIQTSLAGALPDYTLRAGFTVRLGP